jgi:hypothetical protein
VEWLAEWRGIRTVEEYQRLKRRDRQVLGLDAITEADLQALSLATAPPEAAAYNHEVE